MRRNAEWAILKVTSEDAWRGDWVPRTAPITPDELHARKTDACLYAWLVTHYDTLRDGYWPDAKPEEIPTHSGAFSGSWQRNAIEWAAEAKMRQELCTYRGDGTIMWLYYHDGKSVDELAWRFDLSEGQVCRRINCVLGYCSGRGKKPITYEQYVNHALPRRGRRTDRRTEKA